LENINGHISYLKEMGEVEVSKKNKYIKNKTLNIREKI
jgi:hypothetical protein